jgi:transposase
MLSIPPSVKVFVVLGGTDMRNSFDGLSGAVQQAIGQDPLSGHLFVFANKRRNRVKILFWDGSGLWVCAKRLEKGTFSWPSQLPVGQSSVELSSDELTLILGGFDLRETTRRPWYRRTFSANGSPPVLGCDPVPGMNTMAPPLVGV